MRLATWNVNSALVRLPRLLPWLDERKPDIVCLQETKLSDEAFAEALDAPLAERGYEVAHVGEGRWNGVALLSRVGLDDVERQLPGAPKFADALEARAVTATCGGLRVTSVYVPNGRTPDDPHYAYKLEWLAALRDSVGDAATAVVAGDMNIAPTDADVWDPAVFTDSTHVTPPERAALAALWTSVWPTWCATAGRPRSGSSPTGTTAPGASTRTSACASTSCSPAPIRPAASPPPGWIARRARAPGRATTHPSSSISTRRPTATSARSSRRRPHRRSSRVVDAV